MYENINTCHPLSVSPVKGERCFLYIVTQLHKEGVIMKLESETAMPQEEISPFALCRHTSCCILRIIIVLIDRKSLLWIIDWQRRYDG